MVAMAVSVIITMTASFAFMMAFDVYIRSIRQYETEMEMSSLMYGLRSTMMTASYLRYGGPVNFTTSNPSTNRGQVGAAVGLGEIFSVTDDSPAADYGGNIFLVAQFNRERSFSDVAGNLEAVQIVYQRPNATNRFSGAIYIDTERNPNAGGGWVRLSPVNAPQMFTRLTDFEFNNIKVIDAQGALVNNTTITGNVCTDNSGAATTCINRQALSVEIKMTMRYFTTGRQTDFQWCNRNRFSAHADCNDMSGATYADVDRKMTVVFSNNAMQRAEYLPRRPFGNIYFFNPWTPFLGSR